LSIHYPDTHVEALDKRFKGSVGTGAVERVATGFRWTEGPTYFRAGREVGFSSSWRRRGWKCGAPPSICQEYDRKPTVPLRR